MVDDAEHYWWMVSKQFSALESEIQSNTKRYIKVTKSNITLSSEKK